MKRVRLEEWEHHTNANPYKAPEAVCEWFSGFAYGHPRFEDGTFVTTTAMVKGKGHRIDTRNTSYKLGKPKVNA